MEPHRIEFVVHPDGRVEYKIRGIQGGGCSDISKVVQDAVGLVPVVDEATSEAYSCAVALETALVAGHKP